MPDYHKSYFLFITLLQIFQIDSFQEFLYIKLPQSRYLGDQNSMSLEGQGNLGVGKKAENNIIFEIIFLLFFFIFSFVIM